MIDASTAATWVERYVKAWNNNDPDEIGGLFTDDAAYYTSPFADPWIGRDRIVNGWIDRQDAPGSATFRYDILATTDTTAIVRGWTHYHEPPSEYSNIWYIHFGTADRCREFTEWWMERGAS